MFREFIRWALGPLGQEVLQFYQNNDLLVNLIVVAYGLVIFYPHYTMINLVNRLEQMILDISQEAVKPLEFNLILNEFRQRWQEEHQDKTLFLPTKNDLWFEKFSGREVIDLLQIDENYMRMALHKRTGDPPRKAFKALEFKIWEKYRRQLKKGLRSSTPDEILKMRE